MTGGAGYIGSHTAKALAKAGFEPVTFDNLSMGHEWAVKWGPLVRGDLASRDHITKALETYKIEAVIHFAASAFVGESMRVPQQYFENNVTNTLNLLSAMLAAGISRLVFSSSCATYGEPVRIPITEDHPQSPINPYGESKLFIEKALGWYEKAYGLKYVVLRYFNAAGADPDGDIGEDHEPETHLIPLVIQASLCSTPPVEVFGRDYDTPDGTAIRDYVHVVDLADAHVRALQRLVDGAGSLTVNLGSGSGSSVLEVISMVQSVSGQNICVRHTNRRRGDPAVLLADTSCATKTLGWVPHYSGLRMIVETAWRWSRRMPA